MFDVLARLDFVEGGLVHRDVSPSNIVVRTSCLDVSDQIDEGVFDLCLLDFGSAAAGDEAGAVASSNTTVAYAAPELLDGSKSAKMRRSSAVDVYAAASVLYELLYACLPFERFEDELSIGEAKRTKRPAFGASAHRVAEDVSVVLAREPEIAVAVGMNLRRCPFVPMRRTYVRRFFDRCAIGGRHRSVPVGRSKRPALSSGCARCMWCICVSLRRKHQTRFAR